MKVSLLFLGLTLLLAAFTTTTFAQTADDEPTCQLTKLKLLNTDTNTAITIRTATGDAFAGNKYVYYCTCPASVNHVSVIVNADDEDLTYDLEFQSGTGQKQQEFISLQTRSKPLLFTTGTNRIDILPSCTACSAQYTVYCTKTPSDGGGVVGDPQFTGLRGQEYQVHGVSGEVYSIISDEHLQMNSKFVFLNSGNCPIINDERAEGCWSHPGSYLGSIGIMTSNGDRLLLVSGAFDKGFETVEFNGQPMKVGQTAALPRPDGEAAGSITFNTSYIVTVRAGNYLLEFENSDMFINQKVSTFNFDKIKSHGLLGQTWRKTTYKNSIKYIEGAVDDYVVKGKDLFGSNHLYNQFQDKSGKSTEKSISEVKKRHTKAVIV